MHYVYILESLKNRSFYIGYTTDIEKRIKEYNEGKSSASRSKRPYKLIFYECFIDKKDAKHREEYLKSGWGRRSIGKLLKNYLELR